MGKLTEKEFKKFLIDLIKNKNYIKLYKNIGHVAITYKNDTLTSMVELYHTDGLMIGYMKLYYNINGVSGGYIRIDVFSNKLNSLNLINIHLNWLIIKEINNLKKEELKQEKFKKENTQLDDDINKMITPEYKRLRKVKKLLKNG